MDHNWILTSYRYTMRPLDLSMRLISDIIIIQRFNYIVKSNNTFFFNSISFFLNLSMCTPWRDSVYAATPLVLYNFWKYLFVKIAARVSGPDHIVTPLEHLGTVPGPLEHLGTVPGVQVTSLFVLGLRHGRILLTNRYFPNLNTYR